VHAMYIDVVYGADQVRPRMQKPSRRFQHLPLQQEVQVHQNAARACDVHR